jgi:hypothetical protein
MKTRDCTHSTLPIRTPFFKHEISEIVQSARKFSNDIQDVHFTAQPKRHNHRTLHIRDGIGHPIGIQQLRTSVLGEPLASTTKTNAQQSLVQCVTTHLVS